MSTNYNDLQPLFVTREETLRAALGKMDTAGSGLLLLVKPDGTFERTITDGDVRRLLLQNGDLNSTLKELPRIDSITVREGYTRQGALDLMNQHSINHIPVLDERGRIIRLLNRRDLDEQILLSTPHLGSFEREYVDEAFRTNWIAPLGPNVDAFEKELAAVVGCGHAAAVSSGTAAIHLALRLLDVGTGDVVFCSALTFAASANPIAYQGAEPVFIDSEPESWNMSPRALEVALETFRRENRPPKAVIVVNLYGQSADMDPIMQLCERYKVPIIEDAAESLGARYRGRASGTFGLMGIYSFNGNKIITTSGGGMLISEDEALISRARYLATQAREPAAHYEHVAIGYNYRMSNILAGVGRGQLRVLPDRVTARRSVFERYASGLKGHPEIQWMPEPEWSFSNRWLTACVLDAASSRLNSQSLMQKLAAERIEARPVWKPMQLQPVFRGTRYFPHSDSNSVSEALFRDGLCLPSGSNLTAAQQDRVIDTIQRLLS